MSDFAKEPAPDATGKCGELKTIGFVPPMFAEGKGANYNDIFRSVSIAENYTAVVTRSQAEELLAAERARYVEASQRATNEESLKDTMHRGLRRWKERAEKAEALEAKLAAAEKALEFYAKHVSGCRKIGADGDKFRASLDADGGATARAVLGGKP